MKSCLHSKVWIPLLLLSLAALVALWKFAPGPSVAQLKDGSLLRLEGLRFQTDRPESLTHEWADFGRSWLARQLNRPWLLPHSGAPNSLVFWISRRDRHTGQFLDPSQVAYVVAVDSHGCEFNMDPRQPGTLLGAASPGKLNLMWGAMRSFPRREKTFTLRVHGRDNSVLGELRVRNPIHRRFPIGQPQAFPVSQPLGNSLVTLTGMNVRRDQGRTAFAPGGNFTLTPDFRVPPDWEFTSLECQDGTGNDSSGTLIFPWNRRLSRFSPQPVSAEFSFCTNETAWKLLATFYLKPGAACASNQTWTVRNLKVPSPGAVQLLNVSNTWAGVMVRLCALAGPGSYTFSNGVPIEAGVATGCRRSRTSMSRAAALIEFEENKPQILLRFSSLPEPLRLEVVVHSGAATIVCAQPCRAGDYTLLTWEPSADAASVDISLVLLKPEVLQFLVHPQVDRDSDPTFRARPRPRPVFQEQGKSL